MKLSFVQMRAAAAACPLTLGLTSLAVSQTADSVELRILAINDFHGNLRPPPGGIRITDPDDSTRKTVVPAGGRAHGPTGPATPRGHKNTIFVAAGDRILRIN
jgi:5'-nucleotidase